MLGLAVQRRAVSYTRLRYVVHRSLHRKRVSFETGALYVRALQLIFHVCVHGKITSITAILTRNPPVPSIPINLCTVGQQCVSTPV